MAAEQRTMDAAPDVAMPPVREPLDVRYRRWLYANPWVMGEIARTTKQLKAAIGRNPTIAQVWEELRVRHHTTGNPYRWDNSYRAPASRDVVARYPELHGVFRLRRRTAG